MCSETHGAEGCEAHSERIHGVGVAVFVARGCFAVAVLVQEVVRCRSVGARGCFGVAVLVQEVVFVVRDFQQM